MHILLSVNADNANDPKLLSAVKFYQQRGIHFSILYVMPEVITGQWLSMPMVASGASSMLLYASKEHQAGEEVLRRLGVEFKVPASRCYMSTGGLAREAKRLAQALDVDAIIGYHRPLWEYFQKSSFYKIGHYLLTLFKGY